MRYATVALSTAEPAFHPIEHRPAADGPIASLTDRQREVVLTAISCGYYENPRGATPRDVAAELDVEPATVGKHLRIAESKAFSQLFG